MKTPGGENISIHKPGATTRRASRAVKLLRDSVQGIHERVR